MGRVRMSFMFMAGLGAVVVRLAGAPGTGVAFERGREVIRGRN